jgi:hypothetical protein
MADTGDMAGVAALIATVIGYPLAWRYGKSQEAKRLAQQTESQERRDDSDSAKTLTEALLAANTGNSHFAERLGAMLEKQGELTGKVTMLEARVTQLTDKVQAQEILLIDTDSKRQAAETRARDAEDVMRRMESECEVYRMGFESVMVRYALLRDNRTDPVQEDWAQGHIDRVLMLQTRQAKKEQQEKAEAAVAESEGQQQEQQQ